MRLAAAVRSDHAAQGVGGGEAIGEGRQQCLQQRLDSAAGNRTTGLIGGEIALLPHGGQLSRGHQPPSPARGKDTQKRLPCPSPADSAQIRPP